MRPFTILAAVVCIGSALNVYAQDRNSIPPYRPNQPFDLQVSNVTIGNETNAQKLLWIFRYWQDNRIDMIAETFDENVVVTGPDGSVMKGKYNVIKGFRELRDALVSVDITVKACVPLKSPDFPDREAVSIWVTETDTAKDGTVIKFNSNEVWFFNKAGKVVEGHGMVAKQRQ